jgi:hypothetical protein
MATPLDEISKLSEIIKKNLKICAVRCAEALKFDGMTHAQARQKFFTTVSEISEYARLKKILDAAYRDCADRYKMEYWWVVSAMGVDLQRDLLTAFDEWWVHRGTDGSRSESKRS